jgi:hypothetical protein
MREVQTIQMKLRVFPRRTRATPNDQYVRIGEPDLFDPPDDVDSVFISVTFTWDRDNAERIATAWRRIVDATYIGGPAYGDPGNEFQPGEYLAPGNVITSRGCPNRCENCFVPQREGVLRELPIAEGWLVHDNNLLACSRKHIEAVFEMLARQPQRARFVGGFEAQRVESWHARALKEIHTKRVYLAYDRQSAFKYVRSAASLLANTCDLCCYVLIGQPGDTLDAARERCQAIWDLGVMPYAMLYRGEQGKVLSLEWRHFQRTWCRPAIIRVTQARRKQCPTSGIA